MLCDSMRYDDHYGDWVSLFLVILINYNTNVSSSFSFSFFFFIMFLEHVQVFV